MSGILLYESEEAFRHELRCAGTPEELARVLCFIHEKGGGKVVEDEIHAKVLSDVNQLYRRFPRTDPRLLFMQGLGVSPIYYEMRKIIVRIDEFKKGKNPYKDG